MVVRPMKRPSKKFTMSMIALLAATASQSLIAEDRHTISRYTSISTKASEGQANPLATVVSFSFPPTVKTVGQAINYTLAQTGYHLANPGALPEQTKYMLTLPLPSIQRNFSYVSVRSVLQTLSGDAFLLLVDPLRRVVSYVPLLHAEEPHEEEAIK